MPDNETSTKTKMGITKAEKNSNESIDFSAENQLSQNKKQALKEKKVRTIGKKNKALRTGSMKLKSIVNTSAISLNHVKNDRQYNNAMDGIMVAVIALQALNAIIIPVTCLIEKRRPTKMEVSEMATSCAIIACGITSIILAANPVVFAGMAITMATLAFGQKASYWYNDRQTFKRLCHKAETLEQERDELETELNAHNKESKNGLNQTEIKQKYTYLEDLNNTIEIIQKEIDKKAEKNANKIETWLKANNIGLAVLGVAATSVAVAFPPLGIALTIGMASLGVMRYGPVAINALVKKYKGFKNKANNHEGYELLNRSSENIINDSDINNDLTNKSNNNSTNYVNLKPLEPSNEISRQTSDPNIKNNISERNKDLPVLEQLLDELALFNNPNFQEDILLKLEGLPPETLEKFLTAFEKAYELGLPPYRGKFK